MGKKLDIHNWDRRHELTLARLMSNNRISDSNRQAILEFVDECRANNLTFNISTRYIILYIDSERKANIGPTIIEPRFK